MNMKWQQAGQKVKPGLKIAGKLVLLTALRYGPAGVAGWAVKSVARRTAENAADACSGTDAQPGGAAVF